MPTADGTDRPRGRPADQRLAHQLAFLLEVDQLKQVLRRTTLRDGSRRENDAEHSWHLAVMALVLAEHADEPVDLARVVRMLLIHDIVEIDAGDTFLYDEVAARDQADRERAAADRLYALLPADQRDELRALWEEFEARETADARFARAVDRLQPVLLNFHSGGGTWRTHGVTAPQVLAHQAVVGEASTTLWAHVRALVEEAVREGILDPGDG